MSNMYSRIKLKERDYYAKRIGGQFYKQFSDIEEKDTKGVIIIE